MSRAVVLLVDDAPFFLELEKGLLKESSVTVVTAENGQQALAAIRHRRHDLVFMDLHMPEMDGAECCTILKADPELRTIPVVMVTGAEKPGDTVKCRKAGCDAFLAKPIDKKSFLETGRRFLVKIERREKRVPCRTMVVFQIHNAAYYGTSEDLSRHGMYVGYAGEMNTGCRLRASYSLPGHPSCVVEAAGRVVWVNNGPRRRKPSLPEGFGVAFDQITEEGIALLERFLTEVPAGCNWRTSTKSLNLMTGEIPEVGGEPCGRS